MIIDNSTQRNFQKIRVKISKEESYQYQQFKFKLVCFENLIQMIIRTSEEVNNKDNLKEIFQYYVNEYMKISEEFEKFKEKLIFQYAINVPSNRTGEALKYMIYPEEEEIIFTYET